MLLNVLMNLEETGNYQKQTEQRKPRLKLECERGTKSTETGGMYLQESRVWG